MLVCHCFLINLSSTRLHLAKNASDMPCLVPNWLNLEGLSVEVVVVDLEDEKLVRYVVGAAAVLGAVDVDELSYGRSQ